MTEAWHKRRINRVDARTKAMASAMSSWLRRYALFASRTLREVWQVEKGKVTDKSLEDALFTLLWRYGLRQMQEAGEKAAGSVGASWVMPPQVKADYMRQTRTKAKLIIAETENQVRESVNRMVAESLTEDPRPSQREIARRLARTWHGDEREGVFSFERGELIARTELVQAENTGIAQGLSDSGVKRVKWLARTDGKSDDRHHERMNGKTIPLAAMNGADDSKWFKLPDGTRARYPGWPGLPIKHLANCRCTLVPA